MLPLRSNIPETLSNAEKRPVSLLVDLLSKALPLLDAFDQPSLRFLQADRTG